MYNKKGKKKKKTFVRFRKNLSVPWFKLVLELDRTDRTGSIGSGSVLVQFSRGPFSSVLGSLKNVEEPN
jgi:hypothetical protein